MTITTWVAFAALAAGACASPTGSESLDSSGSAIIGGSLDTTHKGVVSLLKQVQGGFYPACSGTLLTQNLVLTAHHCVAGLNSQDGASVECGKTQFQTVEKASSMLISIEANVGQEGLNPYGVSKVWVPAGNSDVCGMDIALLLLSGSGIPANVAKPIEPGLTAEVKPKAIFAAIGYGLQDPKDERGETAGHRMGVSDAEVFCAGLACGTDMVTKGEWIADSPVCSGDSGGPALDQAGRVVGVTSRGDPDCTVGIYSSVYAWKDFIVQGAVDAAEAGNYTPPAWAGGPVEPGGTGGSSATGGSGSGTSGSSNASGSGSGGTTGSGTAGTPPVIIAGMSAGGTSSSPTIDPLGLTCTGQCPGSYKCWAESGQPPGICVPACTDSTSSCPTDYSCSATLGACLPNGDSGKAEAKDSSSCSVAAPGKAGSAGMLWLGAAAFVIAARKRRRA